MERENNITPMEKEFLETKLFITSSWEHARDNKDKIRESLLRIGGFSSHEEFLETIAPKTAVVYIAGGSATRWDQSFDDEDGAWVASKYGIERGKSRFLAPLPDPREVGKMTTVMDLNMLVEKEILLRKEGKMGKNIIIYGNEGDREEISQICDQNGLKDTILRRQQILTGRQKPAGHGEALYEILDDLVDSDYVITHFGGDVTSPLTAIDSLLALYVLRLKEEHVDVVVPSAKLPEDKNKYPIYIDNKGLPRGLGQEKLLGEGSLTSDMSKGGSNVGLHVFYGPTLRQITFELWEVFKTREEFAIDHIDQVLYSRGTGRQFAVANPFEVLHPGKTLLELESQKKAWQEILKENEILKFYEKKRAGITSEWLEADPTIKQRAQMLKDNYERIFGKTEDMVVTCSPGRAEILGNHTDYNEGYTLSANINQNLLMVGGRREDSIVNIVSLNDRISVKTFDSKEISEREGSWVDFPKGVLWSLGQEGKEAGGFDAIIESSIPLGSGVSSSAAIELATANLVKALGYNDVTDEEMVLICKRAENEFVGSPCGFLDQATEMFANGGILLIEYRPNEGKEFFHQKVELELSKSNTRFVIGYDPDSRHVINDGKYGSRQSACFESVLVLKRLLNDEKIHALRDVAPDDFESVREELVKEVGERVANYAEHVVYENQRVLSGIASLKNNNLEEFGELMTSSGFSAINLYELDEDAPELRYVFENVVQNKGELGVLGIRNMGGGFNATTLSLVKSEHVNKFKTNLNEMYIHRFGREYKFLEFTPSPSAGIIKL